MKLTKVLHPRRVRAGVVRRWRRRGTRFDAYATAQAVEGHGATKLLSEDQLHEQVANAIRSGGPFLLGRPGSFESKLVNEYLDGRQHLIQPRDYEAKTWQRIESSGGFPLRDADEIDRFASDYLYAVMQSDIVAVWSRGIIGSAELVRQRASFVELGNIDPLAAVSRGISPWTQALQGRHVLIVHPFRDSILSQHARRAQVPVIQRLVPECTIDVVVPPQTYAGFQQDQSLGWSEHLQRTREQVAERDFDVAIIGAGPYGLPISAFVKQLGRPAIHLGGATQLLFAIRGGRWEQRALYASMMDDTWVRPLPHETPPMAATFEQGNPYW